MDATAIIQTTQAIVTTLAQALTPAAMGAYKVAIYGAQVQALHNLTTNDISTILWLIVGFIFIKVMLILQRKTIDWVKKDADMGPVFAFIVFGWILVGMIFLFNIESVGNVIFDYEMYQHPDAYLSYQIMNKITK